MNSQQKKILMGFGSVLIIVVILFFPFGVIQVDAIAFGKDNATTIGKYFCDLSGNHPSFSGDTGVDYTPCNFTDSTTDTFKITYNQGKTSNAKLNIKKLLAIDPEATIIQLKTNITKTLFYI